MATRQYDFTGSIIDTSSLPTVEDAVNDNEIPNFGQCARRDSWFESQSGNAGIRSISASLRADRQLVYNGTDNSLWEFVAGDTSVDDGVDVLTPNDDPSAPAGRWLRRISGTAGGGTTAGSLVYELDNVNTSIFAAEDLSQNDAVALVCFQNSGFYIFKAQADIQAFTDGFIGFSKFAATTVQGSYTLTIDAALVTGNIISFSINGRSVQQSFTGSSDQTLDALATQLAALDFVSSTTASVQVGPDKLGNDDRVINLFSGNGRNSDGAIPLSITSISITGGASQPNLSFATVTPASGDFVDIHVRGPLENFVGLTDCSVYYLSDTPGQISTTAGTTSKIVGYALASTALLVEPDSFTQPASVVLTSFYRSHGGSAGTGVASYTGSTEVYNFTSWATGPTQASSRGKMGSGNHILNSLLIAVDGIDTSGNASALSAQFNGASWSTDTAPGSTRASCSFGALSGKLYRMKGSTLLGETGGGVLVESYNGSSWTSEAVAGGGNAYTVGGFTSGSNVRVTNGWASSGGGSAVTAHQKFNGSSWSADTNTGTGGGQYASGRVEADNGWVARFGATTNVDKWTGSSWASAISPAASFADSFNSTQGNDGASTGFDSTDSLNAYTNGGNSGSGSSRNNTQVYNGTSFSTDTASTLARSGPCGAIF